MPERPLWTPAYVGLGANLGDPRSAVEAALRALDEIADTRLVLHSSLYRSRPMGPPDQPDFVNAVAALLTQRTARALLSALQDIERRFGRDRGVGPRWGPRTLDLDLLVFGNRRISEPGMEVPHPGLPDRNFVLYPLLEIAPGLFIPGHGHISTLVAAIGPEGLEKLE